MLDLSSLNDRQKEAVTAPLGPLLVLAGAGSGKTRVLVYRIAYLIEQGLMSPSNILALTFTNKAAKEMQGRVHTLLSGQWTVDSGHQSAARSNHYPLPTTHSSLPTMGTFHSVGARLLRHEIPNIGYARSFIIFDTDDTLKVLKEVCQELAISSKFPPTLFRSLISTAKNMVQTPSEFNIGLEASMQDLAGQVYSKYQNFLFRQNAVDFDDLLMLPIKIFQSRPDILGRYQNSFRYILVDEYQDTNPAQYEFLKMLANRTVMPGYDPASRTGDLDSGSGAGMTWGDANLFVVGDDAQSIYGFRGSDIRNILNFEKDFPRAKIVTLDQNYRSTGHILAAAQKVIELNPEQKPKILWTENDHGEAVEVRELEDERLEAEFVAKNIIKIATATSLRGASMDVSESRRGNLSSLVIPADAGIHHKNHYQESSSVDPDIHQDDTNTELLAMTEDVDDEVEEKPFSILDQFLKKSRSHGRAVSLAKLPTSHSSLSEFAVLYRTHAQSRSLEEVFIAAGIPYHIVGGVKFYERKEIKDMLAYVRLVVNFQDLISLKRVINVPARGIGEKSFEIIKQFLASDTPRTENGMTLQAVIQGIGLLKLPAKASKSAQDFFHLLQGVNELNSELTLLDIMQVIVKKINFSGFLKDGTEVGETRWENVEELLNVASEYSHLPWAEGAESFLEEVSLFTEIDTVDNEKDAVTLMTLHSAKGLEFDTVFFVGLEEGVLPHSRSLLNPSELAEEIRLAYVGLTRAKKRLFLTYARARTLFGTTAIGVPSRILNALPESVLWKGGSRRSGSRLNDGKISYEVVDF